MIRITILTLFPKMIKGFFEESIIKRAQKKRLVKIEIINLRDFAIDKHKTVDDRPYGGGAGMLLRADIIEKGLEKVSDNQFLSFKKKGKGKVILTSAKGKVFNQRCAEEYSKLKDLVIICGHYEGIDERAKKDIDEEVSGGDFILTGGEIIATMIVDATVRLLPEVLKKEKATEEESFFEVSVEKIIKAVGEDNFLKRIKEKGIKKIKLLEYPQYTRPAEFKGLKVPQVLLSGNHKEIEEWKIKFAYKETLKKRKDLLFS